MRRKSIRLRTETTWQQNKWMDEWMNRVVLRQATYLHNMVITNVLR